MKKNLTTFLFFILISGISFAQVQSINPNFAFNSQTLNTTITMANGTFMGASAPYQNTDIYLQQGATIIYCYPGYSNSNVYYPYDSLWTQFTIPTNAPFGYYDVHVITYDYLMNQTNWTLPSGFHVGGWAGTIEGDLFFDTNQNGIWDGGEPPLTNHRVQTSPGNIYSYSDLTGHYKIYLDTGTYSVSYVPLPSFTQTSAPLTYSASIPPSYTGYDFGAYSAQALYPQYFYVWHHPMRCQPSLGYTYIDVKNNGIIPVKGSITMVHSSNMSLSTAVPAPDVISGDTLTWYYTSLLPGQSLHIGGANGMNWIAFNDPPAGQTIWYSTIDSVFDMSGNVLTQYADSFSFLVTCSCDPNDKEVYPFGSTPQNYTLPNTDLNYTINFQNTGNDTAFTVIIKDTLDSNLDWNTFELLSSTHPVFAQMDANGILTFTFQDIMLADSNVNEPGSHGAVAYRIKTDSLLPDPTVISNTAYIYFDWNPPVITNTIINTISALQYPSASFVTGDLSFCPGSCINFINNSNPGASFQWTFQGGNPSTSMATDPTNICYIQSGVYDVQLIATNALGADTATYSNYIEVFTVASQAITQVGDTLYANAGFVNYVWYYNGNVITGANNYFYVATQNGDYHVVSFDANGCDVEAVANNVMTDVNSIRGHSSFVIYPNPVKDLMEIRGAEGAAISVYNVIGEKVIDGQLHSINNQTSVVDVSKLPSGIYTVEVVTASQSLRLKIVKQ